MKMSDKKGTFWNNGWVIGLGTIFIGWLADKIFNLGWLTTGWNWFVDFFGTKYSNPLWFLILIFLLGVIIALTLVKMSTSSDERLYTPPSPDWLTYTEDTFDTMNLYKWDWVFDNDHQRYRVKAVYIFCPYDRCRLTSAHCPVCNEWFYLGAMDQDKLMARIEHKLENNLWQDVVKTYPIKKERPVKDPDDDKPATSFRQTRKDSDY